MLRQLDRRLSQNTTVLLGMSWEKILKLARAEVAETMAALPEHFRAHASALPVVYERVPSAALIQDEIEPDTLGLFIGPAFVEEGSTQAGVPPQIILFLENICEMVKGDPDEFREEVRTTFLHELGHYLGLDEDELDERGLL